MKPSITPLFLLFLLSISAFAQVDRATVSGTVKDAAGALAPAAKVTINAPLTGFTREVVTGANGFFTLPAVPVGAYNLKVTLAGFATSSVDNIVLGPGDARTIEVTLQVGAVSNVINIVETSAAPLDSSSPTVGTVIRNEQVQNLPLNGRHWASLMALAPGAVNTGSGNQNNVRFNGRGRDENNFTLDGVDQTGVKDPRQEENLRLVVSTEAISEFRINTATYAADQGNGAGAQVNLVTRTGTNEWRGSVFHFLRNSAADARLWNDLDSVRDPFQLNQFGFRIGGPVIRDRSFFFLSFEGLRQRRGVTFTNDVPSAAFRQSVAASPNAAALQPILNLYPPGTARTSNVNVDTISLQTKNRLDENSANFRFDHRFSQNHSFFFRTSVDIAKATVYNREDSLNTRNFTFRPANHVLQYQAILSPGFVNETRLGVNRSPLDRVDGNGVVGYGPRIDGFTRLRPSVTQEEKGTSYSLINNSSWASGRHTLRFGGEARRIHVNVAEGEALEFRFRGAADFLANRVDSFDFLGEQGTLGERRWYYMPFVQDDFRLSSRLTLNLGLRYEYYSVGKEVKDRGRVFDLACGGFCAPGAEWYQPDFNNFAPRLGLAWAATPKTTVRAGFGVFYGPGQNDDINAAIDNVRDRFSLTRAQFPTLSFPVTPFLGSGRVQPFAPRALDRGRRDFYTNSWSLGIARELPAGLVGETRYVGSVSHKLFTRLAINTINPATGTRPVTAQGTTTFAQGDAKENRGNSNFHAFQASLHRRVGRGFNMGVEYMWSHAISDAGGSGESEQPQNSGNLRGERGNTEFDVRHTMTANYIWELPFGRGRRYVNDGAGAALLGGWQFSGIVSARTGRAINVTISRATNLLPDQNSISIQRPDLLPGVSIQGNRDGDRGFINPAAFGLPARLVYGNAPRNPARGPGLAQFDASLSRIFAVSEHRNIEFRVDGFNLFNRPQYGPPDGFLGTVTYNAAGVPALTANPFFGQSRFPLSVDIGTGTNRSLQFSLRVNF
ncbi:MAG: TonB-dependent receptor domain-containing protein [Blastocatellia bacterium]